MKNKLCLLFTVLVLTGCATTSDEENTLYAQSLEQANITLKSNNAVKLYKKYYYKPDHKAFAQSKINSTVAYATNRTGTEYAIEAALKKCHELLLKKYDEISGEVSCEVVNIDNQWMSK